MAEFVYRPETTIRRYTPWGDEVRRRLAARGMKQTELATELCARGHYSVSKDMVYLLLRGIGVSAHESEIAEINRILEIPEALD